VGSRAGLDGCGKSHPPPGFDPRTVQPVASRYRVELSRPTVVLTIVNIKFYMSFECVLFGK
jgi:hypothetical protein